MGCIEMKIYVDLPEAKKKINRNMGCIEIT